MAFDADGSKLKKELQNRTDIQTPPARSAGQKIDEASASKRRRASRNSAGKPIMIMLAAVGAAMLAAALGGGGGGGVGGRSERYPSLRKFLQNSNAAASQAIDGDVGSVCADPKRWLNSAGHGLLSELPGFDRYNASMLWGTYRPGVYFGLKTRTSAVAVTAGLMWHGGDGRRRVDALRHECSEEDGLGPYGWIEHDGVSYGKQEIADKNADVRLVTSMVKPAELSNINAVERDVRSDVHVAARVEVLPYAEGGAGGPCTVYVYVGLDCSDKDARSHDLAENGGLTVIDSAGESRKSLLIRGTSEQLGNFEFQAWASRRGEGGSELSIAFVGKANVSMVDVKRELEGMHTQHQRSARRQRQSSDIPATQPFLLPNRADESSNVVLVQVTGQAPFVVDLVVRGGPAQGGASGGEDNGNGLEVSPEIITKWLESGSRNFSDRFRKTFSLEKKGFEPIDVAASKAALSNLLGGMGYFAGNSEVRGAGRNGRNGPSFEANLFTAVPSRSFFPRGFLWDEGFHQLLVNAWDRSTSIDVLGHWLSLVHVHDNSGVQGTGVSGGWLPREQILGEEARRRVPSEFIAQDVTVANPPTLLLLVDKLLQGLTDCGSDKSNASSEVFSGQDGVPTSSNFAPVCPLGKAELDATVEFLKKAQQPLDQWMRWLLITQRPGTKGWGGKQNGPPFGAFQWKGRDPGDDRLNALTLASGLDDYPRASHPSQGEEWHVDVLSWLALGCRVMDGLATAVGVNGLPYGELYDELVGGMFELHWDKEHEAFFDHGKHMADGEVIKEAIMRCQQADGKTVDVGVRLEDIEARSVICPEGQRHLYPLGNGHGGLLVRQRWRGGSPRLQQVQHIGYVSIFPLLLKLLPADSPALGSLLAHIRDSAELWSSHGLRSLSASDPLYQVENNPGDEPYWRGHIWVNVNYLALAALRHYSEAEGPYRKESGRIYSELRTNVLRTLLGGYHSTGYFWEQYDDRTGKGLRSHPFTGWTALVVLIMAETY